MKIDQTIQSVELGLDEITKSLPPEVIHWLKQQFEVAAQKLFRTKSARIKVPFVVDTNTITSSLLRYEKGKDSILFKMADNPIFHFHAPYSIENEVLKFIRKRGNKSDSRKLIEGWKKIKRVLNIGSQISLNAITLANMIIGPRDPQDVPFVAMYIDLGADKIITYDKDFEHPFLQPIKIEKIGPMIACMYRGLMSFFILNDLTPSTIRLFGLLILEFIKILFGIVKLLLDFFHAVTKKAFNKAISILSSFFPEIRTWLENDVAVAITIIAGIVGGALLIDKSKKGGIQQLFTSVIALLKPILNNFISWLDKSLTLLLDLVKRLLPDITAVVISLLQNITEVTHHLKLISSPTITP